MRRRLQDTRVVCLFRRHRDLSDSSGLKRRIGCAQRRVRLILLCIVTVLLAAIPAWATEYHGQVVFGGLPVQGSAVKVTATQGDKTEFAITNDQGIFTFSDLTDGGS